MNLFVQFFFTMAIFFAGKRQPGEVPGNKENWTKNADAAYQSLIQNFYNTGGHYFNENNSGGKKFHYWRNAHALDVLTDVYIRTKKKSVKKYMDELVSGMYVQNGNSYIIDYYDDMEWMALACIRAFEATGDKKYKDIADLLWIDIKTGWDDTWGGGFFWNKERKNKNTPANAPACIIAARLYQLDHNPAELAWAKKIYRWQKDQLVDPATGLVWDGLDAGGTNKDWKFTYNQGVFIGSGVELYKITGDEGYIKDALKTAHHSLSADITKNGILKDEGGGDGGLFKGILVRNLVLLIKDGNIAEADMKLFGGFLLHNALVLWLQGTSQPGVIFGANWSKKVTNTDTSTQLSGEMLLEAIVSLGNMERL